ncbi:MAG: penicillin-binding protein 2 [Alphaproteobacteria bacterium]|nr:penicillin-binding protein 2 [Alphaproteobacteria bacterium]MBV9694627.1 penicillin-binding protein 2 [Alphaproteobacteria bacterium]
MIDAPTILQGRILVGALISVAAFALVGVRLVDVALFHAPEQKHGAVFASQPRADLVDRNGSLLARDIPVEDLYAKPHAFDDKHAAAGALAAATGADAGRLEKFFDENKPYVFVARGLTPDAQERVMRAGLPGLEFQPGFRRYYPQGRTTAQVLGVTGLDDDGTLVGLSGLELGLDNKLSDAPAGESVALALDMRVQYILAHEVEASRAEFGAKQAGGLVLDVRTGEILALVSSPGFDPNARALSSGDSTRDIMGQDVYELGSVFKIFSFTLATEDRTMRPDEVFRIGNGFPIGRFTIHEAEHMPATLAARDILALSSNIGTTQIALRSGPARQREFLDRMGLLHALHTELPEARRPQFPSHWGEVETATVSFGHGISVSPLAFAAAAASVVNGGRRIVPTFFKHPDDSRGEQLIKPETSLKMRELLRYVVTNGTGKKADVPGYDVGGKTGSAQKAREHGRGYEHKLVTSFCAVFPVHDPRYLVFVVLDEPHGTRETFGFALAGYTAAPLAGRVIARIAPILDVPKLATPIVVATGGP